MQSGNAPSGRCPGEPKFETWRDVARQVRSCIPRDARPTDAVEGRVLARRRRPPEVAAARRCRYRAPDMEPVLNIAAYRFAPLDRLEERRAELLELSCAHDLRGTILLSEEGINLVLAGDERGVQAVLDVVRRIPGFEDLEVKESRSQARPFGKMLVKLKAEIIAFGVDGIAPAVHTSKRLTAVELKRWLDDGAEFTLLDTRNRFEVEAGTFRRATHASIDDFRDFPDAVADLDAVSRSLPIVTFCTGGIRCEKAAPYLERLGFEDVYQLDGGILRYFEDVGADHYEGDCVVFDERGALTPELAPIEQPATDQ